MSAEGFQRDRSVLPPVAETSMWSVGIAKEQRDAATIAIPGSIGKPLGRVSGRSPEEESDA